MSTLIQQPNPLLVLYRGPLASCNYDCPYCPFAKHRSDAAELTRDRAALHRFVAWAGAVGSVERSLSVLFTPWGEALIRRWYQQAIVDLSHLPGVTKVAIQTNLSCRVDWLTTADLERVGLWCTYHPGEVHYDSFVERCMRLHQLGVQFSVGVVGLREHLSAAQRLRDDLPSQVYLWVNAYKSEGPTYYQDSDVAAFSQLDPMFELNNRRHPSLGRTCHTGTTAISVDGEGTVRRCHFVDRVLGNLYTESLSELLAEEPCPNASCGCHIGYVHLNYLKLRSVFGDGLPERIPRAHVWPPPTPRQPPA